MEYIDYSSGLFENIDWEFIWSILSGVVLPNSGTLIFNIILFLLLGLLLGIIYCILLWRKGIFKRAPKYYNWAVKLYIPLLFIGILFIFGQWGFVRGIYKILNNEQPTIVQGVYDISLLRIFESEKAKNDFIITAQTLVIKGKSYTENYSIIFKDHLENYDTGNSLLNKTKNKVSKFIVDKYNDELYKLAIYGMITVAGKNHIDLSSSLPYEDFSAAMDVLLETDYQDIEKVILEKINEWISIAITSQYNGIVKSLVILLLLILIIPLLEYFIYKKWIAPKYLSKSS